MKTIKPIFFITGTIFMLLSCGKNYLEATYMLTPEELQYLPYSDGQQMVYSNSVNGELLAFMAEPATSEMIKIPEGINTNKYYLFEKQRQVLTSQDISMGFNLEADKSYSRKANLGFFWNTGIDDFPKSIGGSFYVPIDSTDRYFKLMYYDSLQVRQHMYHNVYQGIFTLSSFPGDTSTIPEGIAYPIKYYYCLPYGMIRFDMSDSSSWELDRSDAAVLSVLK